MKHSKSTLGTLLLSVILLVLTAQYTTRAEDQPGGGQPAKATGEDRPFLALWRKHDGERANSQAPYLRFAIWEDGRVLFAKDPGKWGHEMRRGTIAAYRVALLKKALAETGAADLKGTCYLVPDAPCDCLMIALGDKKQMLYWDEVETAGYGINISPKPHHLEFKRCWKAVNNLALVACPDQFEAVNERFQKPPDSWYLKHAIQSE